jgi:hypothetical protein
MTPDHPLITVFQCVDGVGVHRYLAFFTETVRDVKSKTMRLGLLPLHFPGNSASEASAAAVAWWNAEIEKGKAKAANIEKRIAARKHPARAE